MTYSHPLAAYLYLMCIVLAADRWQLLALGIAVVTTVIDLWIERNDNGEVR